MAPHPVSVKGSGRPDPPDAEVTACAVPRPEDLIALNEQAPASHAGFSNEAGYPGRLRAAVADVVARQRDNCR